MTPNDLAALLPEPASLKAASRALALLDAIISPDWEYRYYSFDNEWSQDQQMASMRDGSGDEYSIIFSHSQVAIRGFDHESSLSPFGNTPVGLPISFIDSLPETVKKACLDEPAFTLEDVPMATNVLWRMRNNTAWSVSVPIGPEGPIEDASPQLFETLIEGADRYVAFASEYYDVQLDSTVVNHIFHQHPLTEEIIGLLNPDADFEVAMQEAVAMGYGR